MDVTDLEDMISLYGLVLSVEVLFNIYLGDQQGGQDSLKQSGAGPRSMAPGGQDNQVQKYVPMKRSKLLILLCCYRQLLSSPSRSVSSVASIAAKPI